MIPVNLSIQGFLSYKEPVEINFEKLHLASITGANGAGKSSILDSITWVMFGNARARNDQIINQQSETAQVTLDFLYEQQKYRIRRTKQFEKTMLLEFYILDPESKNWRSLTEHSLNETQKRIHSTLRMDYNTFINASFFLQGKADQFTQLSASERKEILSNILGLEIWEEYLKRAKEIRRSLEIEQNRIESLFFEVLKELLNEEQYQQNLLEAENELTQKITIKESHQTLLNHAIQMENAKENAEKQIDRLRNEIAKNKNSIKTKSDKKTVLSSQIEELKHYLSSSSSIEENYKVWQTLRHQVDEWNEKSRAFHKVYQELITTENEINNQVYQLNSQKEGFETRFKEIENFGEQLPSLEKEISIQINQQKELQSSIDQKPQFNENQLKMQKEISEKQISIKHLETLNTEKRDQLKKFRGAGPDCPFCNQRLTKEHREKYEALVIEEGLGRKEIIEKLNREIDELNKELNAIKKHQVEIEKNEKELNKLNNQSTEKRITLENMKRAIENWETNQEGEYETILEKLETKAFLAPLQAIKESLETKLKEIDYNESEHTICKQKENELRFVEVEYQKLLSARTKFEPISRQLEELINEISSEEKEYQEKITELNSSESEFENLFSDLQDIRQLRRELDIIDKEINHINHRIGAERQKLDTIERKKTEKIKLQTNIDKLVVKTNRYKKIEEAFGKNGVPALLIEQALPEIEMHANELLSRLSNNQLTIHFETQSEYKDKKRQDKKETLEILINDANGNTRAYEMFSGGEAFRINFAVRLALSQVLAKRSGARLETLVVDEGFGSQDTMGRSRLVETINLIKKDFAKILIITHLDELKDAFPGRIEVEKTLNGSQVEVMVY